MTAIRQTLAFFAGAVASCMAFAASPASTPTAPDADLIRQGEYVARLGDCVACHTAPGGQPLAGGLELKSFLGTLHSTNITPDKTHGIGNYTFEQFERAMRQGIAADGHHLYPAMPYPSYAKIGDADMKALYAYLMQGLAPVSQANKGNDIHWPFSMRWGMALWNWLFLDETPFQPNAEKDAAWNRGAYLAQGLGHCGACHTPRGLFFQEKAMSDAGSKGRYFLAGEVVENWQALSLRGGVNDAWTLADTALLLKTGRNRYTAVSGSMVDVIHNSTQHFSDDDITAIATYLKALPRGADDKALPTNAASAAPEGREPDDLFTTRGGLAYAQFCVDCHRTDGNGVDKIFPPMAGNPAVESSDSSSLVHVLLTGSGTAETAAHPRVFVMPSFARLSDTEIAEIANFVRASWGNRQAEAVSASDVKKMRVALTPKVDSTPFVTPRLADMLAQANAQQLVRGMRLNMQTKALLPDHVGDQMSCTSCHLNAGTVADGSPYVGVSAFFPSYAARAGRIITMEDRINGCFLRSMHGKPLAAGSDDLKAMVAYFDWMKGATTAKDKVAGRGVGKISMDIQPNVENGKKVYAAQCAVCHGDNGEGMKRADGSFVYPPLWGNESFNIGAGMARTYTAAAFVKRNMPIGFRNNFPLGQGGLSDQDAVDVAEYFTHMERPDFPPKVKDWPNGDKPKDARY